MNDEDKQKEKNNERSICCLSCSHINSPFADFCQKCGSPISIMSIYSPFERIFTMGRIYRKAASKPRSLFVVVGIWMIFLPAFITFVFLLATGVFSRTPLSTLIVTLFSACISIAIISRTTWNYTSRSNRENKKDVASALDENNTNKQQ